MLACKDPLGSASLGPASLTLQQLKLMLSGVSMHNTPYIHTVPSETEQGLLRPDQHRGQGS